ncbi:hypothetical protein Adt_40536 [Abeliophyllum distichum]|uniref:Uncharacterized protein n=1 Tax=Abeliophyllum distichum TaxID=126358 RepID=A0ABD1Q869_9LAMI
MHTFNQLENEWELVDRRTALCDRRIDRRTALCNGNRPEARCNGKRPDTAAWQGEGERGSLQLGFEGDGDVGLCAMGIDRRRRAAIAVDRTAAAWRRTASEGERGSLQLGFEGETGRRRRYPPVQQSENGFLGFGLSIAWREKRSDLGGGY